MHADEADPVVQNDVDLHRQREADDHAQRIHGTEERCLRVLPQHVAAAVPRTPERRLRVLDDVLQDLRVVKEMLVPVGHAQAGRPREQRGAKRNAENGVKQVNDEGPS